jgi:hypothetical protein
MYIIFNFPDFGYVEVMINWLSFYNNLDIITIFNIRISLVIPIKNYNYNKQVRTEYLNRPKWMDSAVKVYDNIYNNIQRNYILDENKAKSGIYL